MLALPILFALLVLPLAWWTRSRTESRTARRMLIAMPVLGLGVLSVPFDVWVFHAAKCGHRPIETTDFAAAYSYTLPTDPGYSYYPIFDGFACSYAEVAGRHHFAGV